MGSAILGVADPVISGAVTDIKSYVFDNLPAIFTAGASFIGVKVAFNWIRRVLH